ncbi:hypothetical protein HDU93_004705 [Gonapodya sp. JEL0774]|nr:hypothetical protein HDU93_004705 [Gonapodya sp. JEL0774]
MASSLSPTGDSSSLSQDAPLFSTALTMRRLTHTTYGSRKRRLPTDFGGSAGKKEKEPADEMSVDAEVGNGNRAETANRKGVKRRRTEATREKAEAKTVGPEKRQLRRQSAANNSPISAVELVSNLPSPTIASRTATSLVPTSESSPNRTRHAASATNHPIASTNAPRSRQSGAVARAVKSSPRSLPPTHPLKNRMKSSIPAVSSSPASIWDLPLSQPVDQDTFNKPKKRSAKQTTAVKGKAKFPVTKPKAAPKGRTAPAKGTLKKREIAQMHRNDIDDEEKDEEAKEPQNEEDSGPSTSRRGSRRAEAHNNDVKRRRPNTDSDEDPGGSLGGKGPRGNASGGGEDSRGRQGSRSGPASGGEVPEDDHDDGADGGGKDKGDAPVAGTDSREAKDELSGQDDNHPTTGVSGSPRSFFPAHTRSLSPPLCLYPPSAMVSSSSPSVPPTPPRHRPVLRDPTAALPLEHGTDSAYGTEKSLFATPIDNGIPGTSDLEVRGQTDFPITGESWTNKRGQSLKNGTILKDGGKVPQENNAAADDTSDEELSPTLRALPPRKPAIKAAKAERSIGVSTAQKKPRKGSALSKSQPHYVGGVEVVQIAQVPDPPVIAISNVSPIDLSASASETRLTRRAVGRKPPTVPSLATSPPLKDASGSLSKMLADTTSRVLRNRSTTVITQGTDVSLAAVSDHARTDAAIGHVTQLAKEHKLSPLKKVLPAPAQPSFVVPPVSLKLAESTTESPAQPLQVAPAPTSVPAPRRKRARTPVMPPDAVWPPVDEALKGMVGTAAGRGSTAEGAISRRDDIIESGRAKKNGEDLRVNSGGLVNHSPSKVPSPTPVFPSNPPSPPGVLDPADIGTTFSRSIMSTGSLRLVGDFRIPTLPIPNESLSGPDHGETTAGSPPGVTSCDAVVDSSSRSVTSRGSERAGVTEGDVMEARELGVGPSFFLESVGMEDGEDDTWTERGETQQRGSSVDGGRRLAVSAAQEAGYSLVAPANPSLPPTRVPSHSTCEDVYSVRSSIIHRVSGTLYHLITLADGHGGNRCAQFVCRRFPERVERGLSTLDGLEDREKVTEVIRTALKETDVEYLREQRERFLDWRRRGGKEDERPADDGCTVAANLIVISSTSWDKNGDWMACVTLGDTRTVLLASKPRSRTRFEVSFVSEDMDPGHPVKAWQIVEENGGAEISWTSGGKNGGKEVVRKGEDVREPGTRVVGGAGRAFAATQGGVPVYRHYEKLRSGRVQRPPGFAHPDIAELGLKADQNLNLADAMGNLVLKLEPRVFRVDPDVTWSHLDGRKRYLVVMATDGLWDAMERDVCKADEQARVVAGVVSKWLEKNYETGNAGDVDEKRRMDGAAVSLCERERNVNKVCKTGMRMWDDCTVLIVDVGEVDRGYD